ncbi:MAG: acyltransferase family protein [Terriglobales bacterium]
MPSPVLHPRPRPARIAELDGLRALAVLAVISFHYTLGTPWANPVSGLGWAGVDLFFVLSGFLITSILLASRDRPRYFSTFYARRTLRIFPVYYLLLALYITSGWLWGGPQPWRYWAMHALYLGSVVQFFHTFLFHAPVFVFAGLAVLWSLSIEELFYLMWAPVVRWLHPSRLWLVLAAVIVIAPLLRWAVHTHSFPEYEFLPTRFDSLAWGAALALLLRTRPRSSALPRALPAAAIAAGLVFAALEWSTGGSRSNLWIATIGYTLLAVCFAGLVGWIVLSAGSKVFLCRLLRLRPARALGTISYTTYLIHYPVVALVSAALLALFGAAGVLSRNLLALALTLLLAGASWRWLEGPILRLKDRWRPTLDHPLEPAGTRLRTVEMDTKLS